MKEERGYVIPKRDENGWTCPKCGHVNPVNRLKCVHNCSLLESVIIRPPQLNEG